MNRPFDPKPDKDAASKSTTTESSANDFFGSSSFIEEQAIYQPSAQSSSLLNEQRLSGTEQRALVTYNHITYLFYILSYFTVGLFSLVPLVMNYAKRHEADNTWLATHFDWQIKTFWYSLVLFAIGAFISIFALGGLGFGLLSESGNLAMGSILLTGFGLLIIAFAFIWHLYRMVRGWIALTDNRPVP